VAGPSDFTLAFSRAGLVDQRPQPLQPKPGDGLVLLNLLESFVDLLFGEPPPAQQLAAGYNAEVTLALLHPDPLLLVLGQDALEDNSVGELLQRCVRPPDGPQCQAVGPLDAVGEVAAELLNLGDEFRRVQTDGVTRQSRLRPDL